MDGVVAGSCSQSPTSERAAEAVVQQLSSISAVASGLSTPEQETVDLEEPSHQQNGTATLDPRQSAAQRAIVDAARATAGLAGDGSELVQGISDLLKAAVSSSQTTALSIDPLEAFEIAASPALMLGPRASLWLSTAAQLVAQVARSTVEQPDRQRQFGQIVEASFQACFAALNGA